MPMYPSCGFDATAVQPDPPLPSWTAQCVACAPKPSSFCMKAQGQAALRVKIISRLLDAITAAGYRCVIPDEGNLR